MKGILKKLHLILGLISGVVVLIVALSGCIIAFDDEIREGIYSDFYTSTHKRENIKSIDILIKLAKKYESGDLRFIRIKSSKDYNYEFVFKNGTSVFINQFSGQYLGKYNKDEDL